MELIEKLLVLVAQKKQEMKTLDILVVVRKRQPKLNVSVVAYFEMSKILLKILLPSLNFNLHVCLRCNLCLVLLKQHIAGLLRELTDPSLLLSLSSNLVRDTLSVFWRLQLL